MTGATRLDQPHAADSARLADALDRAAQQVRGLHVVVDNVAASVAANPAMPAAQVLARVRAVLPDIPSTPEGAIQR